MTSYEEVFENWRPCPECFQEGNELCPACRTSFAQAELAAMAKALADVALKYEGAEHSAREVDGRLGLMVDYLLLLMNDVVRDVNSALGTSIAGDVGTMETRPWHLRQAHPSDQG